ncbi:hypothetical protein J6TS2_11790 [Heyndrickxia sporothermodurans]|nr:hypothetical protein J6TS2_11790 [Heyndrickxia sporothermodurans]
MNLIDREYKNHVANCKKYGIPFGHYAYGVFVSVADAIVEAKDFIKRADKEALFLALDVEKDTVASFKKKSKLADLGKASQAFIDELKKAGHKTGFYVSHELYKLHGLDKVKSDFLWLPRYGKDNGTPDKKPDYPCCLWQYSQFCKVGWYGGNLDLNLLNGDKTLEWFNGENKSKPVYKTSNKPKDETYKLTKKLNGYTTAADAKAQKNKKTTVVPDTYYVYNRSNGMINVTKKKGVPGSWINPNETVKVNSKLTYHIVKKGEVLSKIAKEYKTSVSAIIQLNKNIENKDLIFPKQKIRVK